MLSLSVNVLALNVNVPPLHPNTPASAQVVQQQAAILTRPGAQQPSLAALVFPRDSLPTSNLLAARTGKYADILNDDKIEIDYEDL